MNRFFKKTFLISLLFLIFVSNGFSQDKFFKDYVTRSWNSEDGIPGNTITDIVQNDDGYIYFGTYGGLVRFDGIEFVVINRLYEDKYNFISVRSVMEDTRGNLWIGSNDEGAFCIKKNGEVVSFSVENGLPNNSIRAFCEDKDGHVWIGTAAGIACIDTNFSYYIIPGFSTVPLENKFLVAQLYCDTAGRIWIVTRDENGLYVYSEKQFQIYKSFSSIKNPIVTTISQDSTDAFWFGIAPYYAVKVNAGEETVYNLSSGKQKSSIVNSIFQDSAKNMWFGLDTGITILHDGTYSYYDKDSGLTDNSVGKIIEDKEKNIWISTDHGGLEKLSYGKFQTTSMNTTVNAIAQDTFRNVIWLAGDNGLYCYSNGDFVENSITKYCKNRRIRHVAVTKDGELLVSVYDKLGQLKFNLDGTVQSWTKETGLAGNRVRVAEKLSNGDIYVGTTTGLSIIDAKDDSITSIFKGDIVDNDYIMCLYEAKDGTVWIGTDGGGVYLLKDREVVQKFTKEDGLAGNVIFKITNLRDDEIWICTGTGASCYKDGRFITFDSMNGFGTDGIFQLIPDFSNRLWGLSNRGIFNLKISEIDEVIEGKRNRVNVKYSNRLDGITSGGVTSTSLSMKDDLGRIWFTLIDGFTIFDPVRNSSVNAAPEILIEDVFVDGEKVDFKNNKIVLKPNAKRLEIKYTGISFISSEQITFKYMLNGFDKKYSEWTNMRVASYTNLRPGTYEFSVIAQNGDEVQGLTDARIKIVQQPYLWERPWFIVLCIVIVISIVGVIIFIRFSRIKRENKRIEQLSIEVIQAFVGAIDAKDKYTNGHSLRVAKYSRMLADSLGKDDEFQKEVYYAALLHDVGKIGIPDTIINKPAALTKSEYEIIKSHPMIGNQILQSISTMKEIAVGAKYHHEHFDGSGYPEKRMNTNIPLIARIICVADAYDAMTSNRSYRKYMKQEYVRNELVKFSGTQFDPEIAAKMIEIIDNDLEYHLHE